MTIRILVFLLFAAGGLVLVWGSGGFLPESGPPAGKAVVTGAENLIENHLDELGGLRVGLVMNPTARIGKTHMLDTLLSEDVNITALFAPEHGFRGEAGAGEVIRDGVDQATGLPVFSLYGEQVKPTEEMLGRVDILIFDMQDVGARFYTYNATMGLVLQAAAESRIPVWVLDRPNPAGGDYVSGWVLEKQYASFVGMYPIPAAHGMTLGELGKMIIGENWLEFEHEPDYRVITMDGWNRRMKWPDTGLSWFPPSPNLPAFENAYLYLGTCFIEGTSLSEGRGTDSPFLLLGSPATRFNERDLARLQDTLSGVEVEKTRFTPVSMPGRAVRPKHEDATSVGIRLRVTDYHALDPVDTGLRVMSFLLRHTPGAETNDYLYRLAGTGKVDGITDSSGRGWQFETESFEDRRVRYLLYD